MTQQQLITIAPDIHLANFNVFDIGANKSYLNQGLIDNECRTQLVDKLDKLHTHLQKTSTPTTLAFSGDALEFLALEQPELLNKYKQLIAEKKHITLASQLYHGTALEVLDKNHAAAHVGAHQKLTTEHFGTPATVLLTNTEADAELLSASGCTSNATLHDDYVLSMEDYLAKKSAVDVNAHPELRSELQEHLLEELSAMAPFVHKTDDQDLIRSFSQLANPQVIGHAHPECGETPYDHYTTVMSILHDMAHRITAAEHMKKGVFVTAPSFGSSPSAILTQQ